jgi:hypothetical protein
VTLFLVANIAFIIKLCACLFLIGVPIFYFLDKKSVVNYKVLNTENVELAIYVREDKNQADIIETIYSKRNTYLKENCLSINYNNEPTSEVNKFLWLKSLNLISDREFKVIKEHIFEHAK